MTVPNMPRRIVANDDVLAHVRTVIADTYADAIAKRLPPHKFARTVLMTMREEHLFFVARVDGMPDAPGGGAAPPG